MRGRCASLAKREVQTPPQNCEGHITTNASHLFFFGSKKEKIPPHTHTQTMRPIPKICFSAVNEGNSQREWRMALWECNLSPLPPTLGKKKKKNEWHSDCLVQVFFFPPPLPSPLRDRNLKHCLCQVFVLSKENTLFFRFVFKIKMYPSRFIIMKARREGEKCSLELVLFLKTWLY